MLHRRLMRPSISTTGTCASRSLSAMVCLQLLDQAFGRAPLGVDLARSASYACGSR